MTREQVIKGLEVCSDVDGNCYDCPYMANGGDPEQCDRQAFKDALALLKESVPVVRCKDCKWYKEGEHLSPNKFCFRLKDANGKSIGYNFADDDYCSCGERREEDER